MDYNEYREFINSIEVYLKTGKQQTLEDIQNTIATKEEFKKELINDDLMRCYEYIKVFSDSDQVEIVSNLANQIGKKYGIEYNVSWLLPYVSEKTLKEILEKIDDFALIKIMDEIEDHIRMIGNRFCDSSTYFWLKTTTVFSRMNERKVWRKLYRRCEQKLKK